VKITDFGLVKTFMGLKGDINIDTVKDEVTGAERHGFSMVGSICGTPPYMSPEQFQGLDTIDIRSDIYAFGCVLYEMICGVKPFTVPDTVHPDARGVLYKKKHMEETPTEPITVRYDCPQSLNVLILKCLEKNPSKRYQDFKSLRDELSEIFFQQTGERITEETPQELETWEMINKGVALGNLGRYQEEIDCLDKVLVTNPSIASAWCNKGAALHALGKYEEAIACFERALELNDRLIEGWNNKGFALATIGRHEEAIECYDKALKINPRSAGLLINKGFSLDKLNKYEDAIMCYDDALKINPQYVEALSSKGASLINLGRCKEALEPLQRFIEIAQLKYAPQVEKAKQVVNEIRLKLEDERIPPEYLGCFFKKGVQFAQTGRWLEAIECFDKVLEISPNVAEVWNNKGFVLANLGRNEEAIHCCDKAIELSFGYPDPWDIKARCLGRLGRYEEAYEAIKKFIKLAPPEYAARVEQAKQALAQLEARFSFGGAAILGGTGEEKRAKKKSWWKKLF
jgi:tetratricopeptide (TPR) repeat protein